MSRQRRWCTVITILIAVSTVSEAVGQTLTAEEENLAFSVWLEEGSTTASTMIRLTLTGATDALRLTPNDLVAVGGEPILRRDHITIPESVQLQDGRPTDVLVTIAGISAPGDYSGQIRFETVAATAAQLEVPVRLVARARPSVEPLTQLFGFQISKCLWRWTCLVNDRLLPVALEGDQRELVFVNRTIEEVVVDRARSGVLARGDKSGDIVGDADLSVVWPTELGASSSVIVPLTVPRQSLRADRYQGSLRIGLNGLADPVAATLVFDVRDGLFPSLLTLFVAICVGRKVQKRKTDSGSSPLVSILSALAGTDVKSGDTHPLQKALAFLLLLVLLAGIGLKTLYLDVSTFGANGFFDYLGLFLWGMSSDIAKKTLENVSS